jgi:hypothetical protein
MFWICSKRQAPWEASVKRDVTAVVVAVLLGCFGAPVAANAQGAKPNATDPLLLGIEEAYRHIKNDYVDPIDDDKILSAAVDGMVAVTVKSDTLYVTRRGSVTGFADVATLFRKINETSDGAIDKQELAYAAISAMVRE